MIFIFCSDTNLSLNSAFRLSGDTNEGYTFIKFLKNICYLGGGVEPVTHRNHISLSFKSAKLPDSLTYQHSKNLDSVGVSTFLELF